jgi:hypothetical protein
MKGEIHSTNGRGGMIKFVDEASQERGAINFKWSDCADESLGPMRCGHGTGVSFDMFISNGIRRPINVRRETSQQQPAPRGYIVGGK